MASHYNSFKIVSPYISNVYLIFECVTQDCIVIASLVSYSCNGPLQWRHKGRDSVSNYQPHDCFTTVYSDADQRKHQSPASLAFVQGDRGPVNSPHKWPVTRKMFPFDDVIMHQGDIMTYLRRRCCHPRLKDKEKDSFTTNPSLDELLHTQ